MKKVCSIENIREFKNSKATSNRLMNLERKKIIRNEYKNNEHCPRKIWKTAKKHLFSENNSNMDRIIDNGKLILWSKNTTNTINEYFQ